MQTIEFSTEKNEWRVGEVRKFLAELNALYNVLYVCDQLKPGWDMSLRNSASHVRKENQLLILHIEINVRGRIVLNIKGIAKIIKQLRMALKDILRISHRSKMDSVELTKATADLLRENSFSDEEIKRVVEHILKQSKFMRECEITVD